MDKKTSFIPKTSFSSSSDNLSYRGVKLGFLLKLSVFLLIISLVFFGGTLFYKKFIEKQISNFSISLERAIESLDVDIVSEMEGVSSRIPIIKKLISKHSTPSVVFDFLEESTLENVRFSDLDYKNGLLEETVRENISESGFGQQRDDTSGKIKITLNGEAKTYTILAQQSQVFENSKDIESFSFSSFALTQEGSISFLLEIIFSSS